MICFSDRSSVSIAKNYNFRPGKLSLNTYLLTYSTLNGRFLVFVDHPLIKNYAGLK